MKKFNNIFLSNFHLEISSAYLGKVEQDLACCILIFEKFVQRKEDGRWSSILIINVSERKNVQKNFFIFKNSQKSNDINKHREEWKEFATSTWFNLLRNCVSQNSTTYVSTAISYEHGGLAFRLKWWRKKSDSYLRWGVWSDMNLISLRVRKTHNSSTSYVLMCWAGMNFSRIFNWNS